MERFIPAKEVRNEIIVLNSRFIATLSPIFTTQEAKLFIVRIQNEFPDATHNVPAYIIGHGNSVVAHCSDDGEPSGTAGKPILSILTASGLGNVAVVVTRYFGGKKLGKGGLFHAYSDATRVVIDNVPRGLIIWTHTIMMSVPYPFFDRIRSSIKGYNGEILGEIFGSDVTVTARFPVDDVRNFHDHIQNLSRGQITYVLIEETETIAPVQNDKLIFETDE
jgi:uncharacterized YigZ family protein